MLLHGIHDADIQREDTLLHPLHREAGELERFDRVIANPPFSQNYTRGEEMEFQERFRWGWCPTSGKKGDLMFAQHMLAVCKPGGMVATVMPHGVLFRGGAEKQIRQKLLEEDLIEAIIGLPPNLFYGASIPACILVMRPNLSRQAPNSKKPEDRRGRILFINADAEYHAGRAQNYLRPEHVEKIVSTFDRFEDIPGYSRRVDLDEIRANDFNLNIRRYVDNSPPPEPHDVRAHLLGGVPVAEVEARRDLYVSLGFDPARAPSRPAGAMRQVRRFRPGPCRPRRHPPAGRKRSRRAGPRARRFAMRLPAWWGAHSPRLVELPERRDLNARARRSSWIPSSPRWGRSGSSTASLWRASSPPGGPRPFRTSRPCSKTASPACSTAGWTPSPMQLRTTIPPARPSIPSVTSWSAPS